MKNPFSKNPFGKKKSPEEKLLDGEDKSMSLGSFDNIDVDGDVHSPNQEGDIFAEHGFDDEPSLQSHGFVYDNYEAPESMAADDTITDGISEHTPYNNGTWYSLNGRIGRIKLLSYSFIWGLVLGLLFVVLIFVASTLIITAVSTGSFEALTSSIVVILILLISIPITVFTSIILPRRRLHDIGKSGWWLLLYFIPVVSLILVYWLFIKAGDKGVNAYGAPSEPNTMLDKILAGLAILGIISYVFMFVAAMTQYQRIADMQREMTPSEVTLEEVGGDVTLEDGVQGDDLISEDEDSSGVNNGEILNTNPEADPEVQAAIDAALASSNPEAAEAAEPANNSGELSYEEFLRASETPVLVEEAAPEPVRAPEPSPAEDMTQSDSNNKPDMPEPTPEIRVE